MTRPTAGLAELPVPLLSAVTAGKLTNRITKLRDKTVPIAEYTDKRGRDWRQLCVSMPVDEAKALDDMAGELGISRSALLRVAARQFCQSVRRL